MLNFNFAFKYILFSVTHSIEALMDISKEIINNTDSTDSDNHNNQIEGFLQNQLPQNKLVEEASQNIVPSIHNQVTPVTMSYSNAFKNTGAKPKRVQLQNDKMKSEPSYMTDQLRKIKTYHDCGYRILILMRGVSGSGKSYLARKIIDITIGSDDAIYKRHIFSTDDYFIIEGRYCYDRFRLSEAHEWNKYRVQIALRDGVSPVIVDNTNLEIWEPQPYVQAGVLNGYYIELVEPRTPWATDIAGLAKRNTHNVPHDKIKLMLQKFRDKFTVEEIMKVYGLSYPIDRVPPVFRNIPYVSIYEGKMETTENTQMPFEQLTMSNICENSNVKSEVISNDLNDVFSSKNMSVSDISESKPVAQHILENLSELKEDSKNRDLQVTNNEFEDFVKIEKEWESSEQWEEVAKQNSLVKDNPDSTSPRPKRNPKKRIADNKSQEKILPNITEWQDWRTLSNLTPECQLNLSEHDVKLDESAMTVNIEKQSVGTTMHDHDINKCKIISTEPRDINIYYIPNMDEKIPNTRMLDKSSYTNEDLLKSNRCVHEEKHFLALKKMFKNIATTDLREIFDKCCGDVNWAVEIVLDGVANNELNTITNDEEPDMNEDEINEHCECLSAYDIIPSKNTDNSELQTLNAERNMDVTTSTPVTYQKKPKKETIVSGTLIELKKHLEENVVISERHYSEHCLKIRNFRHGISSNCDDDTAQGPSHCRKISHSSSTGDGEDNCDTESDSDFEEKTIYLGTDFLKQIDEIYGRKASDYPKEIVPLISMPMSLLNQINALWLESLTHQLATQKALLEIIMREDEEFARYDFFVAELMTLA